MTVRHYDFYAQALSKLERSHAQDVADLRAYVDAGRVEPARLRELFEAVAPELVRYPAIEPGVLRARVWALAGGPA